MEKKKIQTSLAPEIIITEVQGELQFKGWEEAEVMILANAGSLQVEEQQDEMIQLRCTGNLEMRAPVGAIVQLEQAYGNARFRMLEDSLKILTVNGSLYLRDVAEISVEDVNGNLLVRHVAGDLKAQQVNGNVVARDIQGECLLGDVSGNLDLRDVEGNIQVTANGNARLRLSNLAGSHYEVKVDGNVHCRLPEDASLQLNLVSGANYILVKLPDSKQLIQQESYQTTLGDGIATMNISAGGNIHVFVRDTESEEDDIVIGAPGFSQVPQDFGDQISRQVEEQIEAQMEMMNRQLNDHLASLTATFGKSGMSPEETERIIERARQQSERAAAQAQEKLRRAQEKLERKMEANRRREDARRQSWGTHSSRGGWHVNFSPPPPPPPSQAVSDEERLAILRMLEQKKITLEEAEGLLAALEGQE
jgi:hypothetical protein